MKHSHTLRESQPDPEVAQGTRYQLTQRGTISQLTGKNLGSSHIVSDTVTSPLFSVCLTLAARLIVWAGQVPTQTPFPNLPGG